MWPLLQATAAATLAWLIATHVVRHHQPFFAPIAAMAAMNTTTGERGSNAFRLLLGVLIGIVVGETAIALFGGGYGRLALAVFTAMIIARRVDGARIMIAQAGASAILTVAMASGEAGTQRLGDAMIGGGVALLFTQVLFSPEPVGLLRRAEAATLREIARFLALAARSLDDQDETRMTEGVLGSSHDLRDRVVELHHMIIAARRVARHSLYWRSRQEAAEREATDAQHLELLAGSLLMLVRSAMASDPAGRRAVAPIVRELGEVISALAAAPDDRGSRERGVARALDIARQVAGPTAPPLSARTAASLTASMVATDLIAFLGVEPARATAAVGEEAPVLEVPPPPKTPRAPFRS